MGPEKENWWVYMLRCQDGTLYTGATCDIPRRLAAHNSGKGAKYTRGRGPVELVYTQACGTHSQALRREAAVKKLTRPQKWELVREQAGLRYELAAFLRLIHGCRHDNRLLTRGDSIFMADVTSRFRRGEYVDEIS